MGLEEPQAHKHSYFVRRPYVYKRGPHAKTLIRERRQQEQPETGSFNEYPKELEGLWLEISFQNPIFDNQDHESGVCSCKCTPVPKQNPTCPPDDKRRRKREDKNHLRGRPYAHLQPAKEGY